MAAISAGKTTETNLSGINAMGAARTTLLRQAVTAAADGAAAIHLAEEFLTGGA